MKKPFAGLYFKVITYREEDVLLNSWEIEKIKENTDPEGWN